MECRSTAGGKWTPSSSESRHGRKVLHSRGRKRSTLPVCRTMDTSPIRPLPTGRSTLPLPTSNASAPWGPCQPVCPRSRHRGRLPALPSTSPTPTDGVSQMACADTEHGHTQQHVCLPIHSMPVIGTGMTHPHASPARRRIVVRLPQCLVNENAELRTRLAQLQQEQAAPQQPPRLALPGALSSGSSLAGVPRPCVGQQRARTLPHPGSVEADWDWELVSAHGVRGSGGLQAGSPGRGKPHRGWSPAHAAPSCVSGVLPVTGGRAAQRVSRSWPCWGLTPSVGAGFSCGCFRGFSRRVWVFETPLLGCVVKLPGNRTHTVSCLVAVKVKRRQADGP